MTTLSQAKTLGGVGAILGLLTFIPYVGGILGIVGIILILIAVNHVSNIVEDRNIFKNMIYAVILRIVGIVVGAVTVFASVFRFIGFEGWTGPIEPLPSDIMGFILGIVLGLVIIWIFYLISAFFLRRSYNSIAEKLNVRMFGTVALLYLIGAALAIVLVGFIIIFIAQILEIVAFFSIPSKQPSELTNERICVGCGRAISGDTKFCPHCGKEIPP
jgi:uncharacterized membrane protein